MGFLIYIAWFIAAILVMFNIAPYARNLSLLKQSIVFIVIALGAPFLLVAQTIELILDMFLEEGWNDDNDDFPRT